MGSKKRSLLALLSVVGLVLLLGGCHKKQPPPPPPPPPEAPPPPPAPTANLTAEPATIEKGQSATLSWTSQNATDADIEPAVGKVQVTGSSTVTPDDSTTYVLTVKGAGGTQTASARVTVTQPPPPPPPPPPSAHVITTEELEAQIKDAYFDFDKSDIRADAQQALTADADVLKNNPTVSATIEGHCDERGSEEYNLGLGDRRATAAKAFLTNLGVPGDKLTTVSYGKDRPQCTEHSEDCWQKNRRVHLVLK